MVLIGSEKEPFCGTTQMGEAAAGKSLAVGHSVPFHAQTLADFVGLVGRFFYDDACIVLLDFLAREQRAFLEADLRERLGWREALVQQKLYLLEKHFLVIQDGAGGYNSQPRSVRATTYWRINHKIYAAVLFRYNQLVDRLAQLLEDVARQHEFECSDADCDAKYTALEAAGCSLSLEDEHPLCTHCGSLLRPSAFEETRQKAKEKRTRALYQLEPLRQSLLRISTMEIPVFAPYSKQEKKLQEQKETNTRITPSGSVPSYPTEASASDLGASGQKSATSVAFLDKSLGSVDQELHPGVTLSSASVVSAPGRLRHQDQGAQVHENVGGSGAVPIPWFESSGQVTAAQTPARPLDVQVSIGRHGLSGEGVATGVATKRPVSAGGTETSSNHGICFDLKGRGGTKKRGPLPGASISFSLGQGLGRASSGPLGVPLGSGGGTAATSTSMSPREAQSQELAASTTDDGSGLASSTSATELEIYVEKLGKSVKLSDITEEVEQLMTDEEYKIYYNTAEL